MLPEERLGFVALNLLPGLGSVLIRRALERYGNAHDVAFRVPTRDIERLPGFNSAFAGRIDQARKQLERQVASEIERALARGIRIVALGEADYPALLADLPDPPPVLYVRGELPLAVVRVAVVGSRQATAYGRRVATGLASGLAARGIEVVSGGARGIDTCAHRAVLEEGGRTVAVLGAGFLHPYPRENVALFDDIAARGAVISEFPFDTPPHPENFPRRNRVISGLSAAVVVVEAGLRSGSLVTARHGLEQNREVLAVPGPVSSTRSQGCHLLIQQGAKLLQNIDDLIEELSPMYGAAVGPDPGSAVEPVSEPFVGATADEATVLRLLDEVEPVQLDDLADRVPFGVARLQAALFGLELRTAVETLPGYRYCRRTALPAGLAGGRNGPGRGPGE